MHTAYMCLTHSLQVVNLLNLPNCLIIDYSLGHAGSVHDSSAFEDSYTFQNHNTLFSEDEWIWVDSAYATQRWCVTPYKNPAAKRAENKNLTTGSHEYVRAALEIQSI